MGGGDSDEMEEVRVVDVSVDLSVDLGEEERRGVSLEASRGGEENLKFWSVLRGNECVDDGNVRNRNVIGRK